MCGLFGVMGPGIILKDLRIVRELGILSQIRGVDGAGIYQIKSAQHNYNKWQTHEKTIKTCENFSSLMTSIDDDKSRPEYRDILSNIQVDLIMGHVRWQTKGAISDANSHPFIFQTLVGAHNGTLKDKKYEDKTRTDSELMFRDMNERGIAPVLRDLDKFSAYAISVYDKNDHHMYFARNHDRTLAMAFLESRGVMFWASEVSMLKFILDRASEKYRAITLNPYVVAKIYAPNITVANITKGDKGFIDLLEVEETLPDPFVKKEVVSTNWMDSTNWTTDKYSFLDTKDADDRTLSVKIPNSVDNKVVKLPTQIKTFHSRCKCGTHQLNLLQSNYARRGILKGFRFDGKDIMCVSPEGIPCSKIEVKHASN